MEAIKKSKIIIFLLILYIGLTILVVTLDKINRSEDKSSSNKSSDNSEEISKKDKDNFLLKVSDVYADVIDYLTNNELGPGSCITLSDVSIDYTGSAYVTENKDEIYLWYSNGKLFIDGKRITSENISEESISNNYSTDFYLKCGVEE